MKKVYVCSPLRGNIERNIASARGYCRRVADLGHVPIAPHVYFTQFLDDRLPDERERGILCGLELLKVCDEVWVFRGGAGGMDELSEGMMLEVDLANGCGIPVVDGFLALELGRRG